MGDFKGKIHEKKMWFFNFVIGFVLLVGDQFFTKMFKRFSVQKSVHFSARFFALPLFFKKNQKFSCCLREHRTLMGSEIPIFRGGSF